MDDVMREASIRGTRAFLTAELARLSEMGLEGDWWFESMRECATRLDNILREPKSPPSGPRLRLVTS